MTDAEKKKNLIAKKQAKIKDGRERVLQAKNISRDSIEHNGSIEKGTSEESSNNVKKCMNINAKSSTKINSKLNAESSEKITTEKKITDKKSTEKNIADKKAQKDIKEKKISTGGVTNSKKNDKASNKNTSNKLEEVEEENTIITQFEKAEDTVSLKEIRKALVNSINESQRHSIIKDNIINVLISIVIILYLIIVYMGSKNMLIDTLITDLKVFSICFAVMGLIILEAAYKRDNHKLAFSGGEILIFGAVNLCLMYVIKIYPLNLLNVMTYISIIVAVYYLAKVIIVSIKSTKKYKKDNNDIKEIVKK